MGVIYILLSTNKIKDSIISEGFSEYKSLIRLAKIAFKEIALWPKKSDSPYIIAVSISRLVTLYFLKCLIS